MNPRLIILILVAAGMAVFFAAVKSRPAAPASQKFETGMTEVERKDVALRSSTLDQLPLPGQEPPEEPEVSVQVEVDRSQGKNRLYFNISEAHGYYVEQFRVLFWYVDKGVTGPDNSPLVISQFFDRYLPARETLRVCLEVVPAELEEVDGDMGETRNWDAEIEWFGRARAQNPDPMPPRTDLGRCD